MDERLWHFFRPFFIFLFPFSFSLSFTFSLFLFSSSIHSPSLDLFYRTFFVPNNWSTVLSDFLVITKETVKSIEGLLRPVERFPLPRDTDCRNEVLFNSKEKRCRGVHPSSRRTVKGFPTFTWKQWYFPWNLDPRPPPPRCPWKKKKRKDKDPRDCHWPGQKGRRPWTIVSLWKLLVTVLVRVSLS